LSGKSRKEKYDMKTLFILALLAMAVPAAAGDHPGHAMKTKSGWFDMENCAFCKKLVQDPVLLDHVKWENHAVASGMLSITVVETAYAASWAKANAAMETVAKDMQSGKVDPTKVKMCGHCAAYGQLMMAGAKTESVDGEGADVMLVTSNDPQVVAQIHEFVKRTNQEMAEMAAADLAH
jgi:hypothetical protein